MEASVVATNVDHLATPEAPVLTDGSFLNEQYADWLPPRELLTVPDEPVDTPVDERGLVDIPNLLALVQSWVDPSYQWSKKDSTHHFYFYANLYPSLPGNALANPAFFRDMSIHKGELPREFENLLHLGTRHPQPPTQEVMHYRVESWLVARSLFDSARNVVRWRRLAEGRAATCINPEKDVYAQEWMAETIDRHFSGVERHMTRLEAVPPEFRLVEPANTPAELATSLGGLVLPRSLKIAQAMRNSQQQRTAA